MATTEAVTVAMKIFSETYLKEISKETARAYDAALSELTDKELSGAIAACMRQCKYFPSPAEIIEFAGKQQQTPTASIGAIFDRLIGIARKSGRYRAYKFTDPLTAVAVRRIGGWSRLCDATEIDARMMRSSFVDAYMSARTDGHTPGEAEVIPSAQGKTDSPITIDNVIDNSKALVTT